MDNNSNEERKKVVDIHPFAGIKDGIQTYYEADLQEEIMEKKEANDDRVLAKMERSKAILKGIAMGSVSLTSENSELRGAR